MQEIVYRVEEGAQTNQERFTATICLRTSSADVSNCLNGVVWSSNELKKVLWQLYYTFRNGPWKHTFCSFWYDPPTDHRAVAYQNVILKLKKKEAEDYEADIWEHAYYPTFSDLSAKYIRAYQLGDIAIEAVQELVRGSWSVERQAAARSTVGWHRVNMHIFWDWWGAMRSSDGCDLL